MTFLPFKPPGIKSALTLSVGFHLAIGLLSAGGDDLLRPVGSEEGPVSTAEVRQIPVQMIVHLAEKKDVSPTFRYAAKPPEKAGERTGALGKSVKISIRQTREKSTVTYEEALKEIIALPEEERIDAALDQPIEIAEQLTRYVSLCNSPYLLPNRAFF